MFKHDWMERKWEGKNNERENCEERKVEHPTFSPNFLSACREIWRGKSHFHGRPPARAKSLPSLGPCSLCCSLAVAVRPVAAFDFRHSHRLLLLGGRPFLHFVEFVPHLRSYSLSDWTMTQKKKEPINLRWTPEMDESFIDALLEEMMNGNRPDGTFSTFAYGNMVQTLNNRFGSHITKQHLKNRKKTLSQRFAELYDLFNGLSGFSWSPLTKLFEADNQVWDDLIKRKPNARKWKNTPVLHYDKLYELFSVDKVSVGTTSVREQKRKASMIENESNQDRFEKMTAGIKELVDVMRDGNVVAERQVQVVEKHTQIAEKQARIAEKQAQIAEKGLSIFEKSRPHHYNEGEVWTAIEKIGITEEQKLKYYFFLCNDERHKLIFFGVPPHIRLQTLLKLMADAGAK